MHYNKRSSYVKEFSDLKDTIDQGRAEDLAVVSQLGKIKKIIKSHVSTDYDLPKLKDKQDPSSEENS